MKGLRLVALLGLSAVMPGAGHVAAGEIHRGLFWVLAATGVVPFLLVAGVALGGVGTVFIAGAAGAIIWVLALFETVRLGAHHRPLRWWAAVAVVTIAVAVGAVENALIRAYVTQAFTVLSVSMEPALLKGDQVLSDRLVYRARAPRHNELVVYRFPPDPRRRFVHRVVAGPGDRLRLVEDRVEVNGTLLGEPYATGRRGACDYAYGCTPLVVPAESYFVLGDRRDASHDSRFWGFVRRDAIEARVAWVYWSWDETARSVRHDRLGRVP